MSVVSCGWLEPPKNGKKEGTNYLNNSEVTFTCNKGYKLHGPYSRKCQADGTWSGQTSICVSGKWTSLFLLSFYFKDFPILCWWLWWSVFRTGYFGFHSKELTILNLSHKSTKISLSQYACGYRNLALLSYNILAFGQAILTLLELMHNCMFPGVDGEGKNKLL